MRLGVNIDHIATLRQQRKEGIPDPVEAALEAQRAGAHSIVAHLREDRRHIQDADIQRLKNALRIPLAMEMAATDEMVLIACRVKPSRVCLVPEKRKELTTEGGLDISKDGPRLWKIVHSLAKAGIDVSLFVDPIPEQMVFAKAAGAHIVELHTGSYSRASGPAHKKELRRLAESSYVAKQLGLRLHAGHGLNHQNVRPVARLPGMEELNIGFSIIARAVYVGLGTAIKEMKSMIEQVDRPEKHLSSKGYIRL